jgi:lysophospholipase L1-like esterase
MKNSNKFSLLLLFITLFTMLIISELATRSFIPQITYSDLLLLTGEQYTEEHFIPFTLKANYKAKSPSMEFPGKMVTIRTNSLGLRGKEINIKKPNGVKRILVLGDSYTFGVYCENSDVYPVVLETLYEREGLSNIEVINAGYADGWSPDQHYAWFVNRGIEFGPDIVIYGFFIGNDITGISSSTWIELDRHDLPVRIVNPNIYIDEFGRIRSKVKDSKTVGQEYVYRIPLLRESHFFILLNRALQKLYRNTTGENALNRGWGDTPFDPILKPSLSKEHQGKEELFLKLLNGMREVANNNGAKFLLLMIPVNFQVEPEEFLKKVLGSSKFDIQRDYFKELEPILEQKNIEYLNLLSLMRSRPEGKYYPRNGEVHFNPSGHRFTANELKKKLDELGWLKH